MASDVSTLADFAEQLLAVAVAALATTDAGAPAVQFVSPGEPALDCPEMVAVHVTGLQVEPTQPATPAPAAGHRQQAPGMVQLAGFAITISRCAPGPNPPRSQLPPADAISAVARQTNQDIWAVWNHLYWLARDGSLFGGACSEFYFDAPTPLTISGQSAGWVARLRTRIDGYQPAGV